MSKNPPILIFPPAATADPPPPLDAEPPPPDEVLVRPPDAAWSPATSPWAETAVDDGWVNDLTVITPSTAASTIAAARSPIAIRSRMPRATTGSPPQMRWAKLPLSEEDA
jgi:hypothetical protein